MRTCARHSPSSSPRRPVETTSTALMFLRVRRASASACWTASSELRVELPTSSMILVTAILRTYRTMGSVHRRVSARAWEGVDAQPYADPALAQRAVLSLFRDAPEANVPCVFAGSSSGTLLAAALRYCREQNTAKRVVTFVCDSGNKYLSKVFDDVWLAEQGLSEVEQHGDLRDLVARSHREGGTLFVGPDDTLLTAYGRMRRADVSQLPVLAHGALAGVIDESDILLNVHADSAHFGAPVASAMTDSPSTLPPTASLKSLQEVLDPANIAVYNKRTTGEKFLINPAKGG